MRELSITIADGVTTDNLLASLSEGKTVLHTERSDGTFRRVHFLSPDSKDREKAEWVLAARTGNLGEEGSDPMSMKAIAKEMHVSVPTVRRLINDLLLTHEIEEMDQEDLDELLNGGEEAEDTMVVTNTEDTEEDTTTETTTDTDNATDNS